MYVHIRLLRKKNVFYYPLNQLYEWKEEILNILVSRNGLLMVLMKPYFPYLIYT